MCNLALLALKSKSSDSWPQPMLSPLARHLRTSARAAWSTPHFFVGTMESDAPCVRAVDETDAPRGQALGSHLGEQALGSLQSRRALPCPCVLAGSLPQLKKGVTSLQCSLSLPSQPRKPSESWRHLKWRTLM